MHGRLICRHRRLGLRRLDPGDGCAPARAVAWSCSSAAAIRASPSASPSSPLAGILIEQLADRYDLPRVRPLAAYGAWQRAYPDVAVGLKRGFTYFKHDDGPPLHGRAGSIEPAAGGRKPRRRALGHALAARRRRRLPDARSDGAWRRVRRRVPARVADGSAGDDGAPGARRPRRPRHDDRRRAGSSTRPGRAGSSAGRWASAGVELRRLSGRRRRCSRTSRRDPVRGAGRLRADARPRRARPPYPIDDAAAAPRVRRRMDVGAALRQRRDQRRRRGRRLAGRGAPAGRWRGRLAAAARSLSVRAATSSPARAPVRRVRLDAAPHVLAPAAAPARAGRCCRRPRRSSIRCSRPDSADAARHRAARDGCSSAGCFTRRTARTHVEDLARLRTPRSPKRTRPRFVAGCYAGFPRLRRRSPRIRCSISPRRALPSHAAACGLARRRAASSAWTRSGFTGALTRLSPRRAMRRCRLTGCLAQDGGGDRAIERGGAVPSRRRRNWYGVDAADTVRGAAKLGVSGDAVRTIAARASRPY